MKLWKCKIHLRDSQLIFCFVRVFVCFVSAQKIIADRHSLGLAGTQTPRGVMQTQWLISVACHLGRPHLPVFKRPKRAINLVCWSFTGTRRMICLLCGVRSVALCMMARSNYNSNNDTVFCFLCLRIKMQMRHTPRKRINRERTQFTVVLVSGQSHAASFVF